jgi:cell division protein FtsW
MEIYKPMSFDKAIAFITLFLLAVGFIMVFSTTAVAAGEKYNQRLYFLLQQVIGAGAGLVVIGVILSIRKPFYQNPFLVYALLTLSIFLLALCFVMPSLARVNRWIMFSGIRFQPSELAKISLVLFLAHYLDRKRDRMHEWRTLVFPVFIVTLCTLLILKEPDFGTAILVFFICSLMLYLGGVRLLHLGVLGLVAAIFFAFFLFQASYRIERITGFMAPDRDPLGHSYQPIQSKLAVGSGGLFGVSLGESTQKLDFLPSAHTDYIYAILGEEFGLLGSLTILLVFFIFLWRGLAISSRAPTAASQLVALGLTLAMGVQALLNISVVLGLGPSKGVPLPLVSFGRSSLICNLAAIGIILNISQRKGNNTKKI